MTSEPAGDDPGCIRVVPNVGGSAFLKPWESRRVVGDFVRRVPVRARVLRSRKDVMSRVVIRAAREARDGLQVAGAFVSNRYR